MGNGFWKTGNYIVFGGERKIPCLKSEYFNVILESKGIAKEPKNVVSCRITQ